MLLKHSSIVLLKYLHFVCLLSCFNISLSEFSLFGMRFAILNISSGPIEKIKNILMSDTSSFKIVYGQNSPTYFVNGKIVQVKSKNRNPGYLQGNQTNTTLSINDTNNRGCDSYTNENLPENYIAVSLYYFNFQLCNVLTFIIVFCIIF
jgi:hypothetical protein